MPYPYSYLGACHDYKSIIILAFIKKLKKRNHETSILSFGNIDLH